MNKTLSAFLATAALATVAQAITITGVSAHQRWPWNNLIDIDFNIGGAAAGDTFKIDVKATYANGSQTLIAKRFVTDPVVKGGDNRITWDIGLDCPNLKANDLRVAVTATPFTNGTDGAWMIIDLSGGKNATSYPVRYTTTPPVHSVNAEDACKMTEMWLKRIKGGSFMFCKGDVDPGYFKVNLTKDYYMGVFECTQQQWAQVTGAWPSSFSNTAYRASRPVENLSLQGVFGHFTWPKNQTPYSSSFVGKMRARTGLSTFNLPTDAQWEWASRCGYAYARNPAYKDAEINFNQNEVGMDYMSGFDKGTKSVGTYASNPWGLYDILGNVFEVILDAGVSESNLQKYYGVMNGLTEEQCSVSTVEVDDPIGGPIPEMYPSDSPYDKYKSQFQYYHVARGGAWYSSLSWINHYKRSTNPDALNVPGTRGARFVVTCE